MARKRKHVRLNVFLNSRLVGQLNREASGAVDFRYDADWLAWDNSLPVSLSMPLREDRYVGAPVAAVFDNLLPDNQGIRRRVAERTGAEGTDAYSLLAALGRDCVGALQFLPQGKDPGAAGVVEGQTVGDEEIADILRNLARNPLGVGPDDDFRISIAGAQEKTALLKHHGRWMKPAGTSATTHILKPQIGQLSNGIDLSNSVENEYLCLKLIKAFGLDAAEVEIATFADQTVLVVERFDRLWTSDRRLLRVPQEDCCQALSCPWTQKYESEGGPGVQQITKLLAGADDPDHDQRAFLEATVIFWLLGATDGHAKNFSIQISPGGGYRLTPIYDVVSAQPSYDAGHIRHNQFKLAMAVGQSRHYGIDRIMPRHFVQSAEIAGVGRKVVEAVFDYLIETTPKTIDRVLGKLPAEFPPAIAGGISEGLSRRVKVLTEHRNDER